VPGVSDWYSYYGQDLDYYWQGQYESVNGDYQSNWYYELALASGNQMWESYYYDDTSDDWSYLFLTDGAGVWGGYEIRADWDNISAYSYDLYLYQSWPGSFFLVDDLDDLPAGYR
jgi:hypothetical protein